MAVETKPLFSPELLRKAAHAFPLPATVEAARPRLQHWADLINQACGLTPGEVKLMWATAPPRMPFTGP